MNNSHWRCGRGWLRRVLLAVLPHDDWSQEYITELDYEIARRAEDGHGWELTFWYLGQLLRWSAIGFVWTVRARNRSNFKTIGKLNMGSGIWMDTRQAWRRVIREPWAAIVVIVTIAVGIGSVTAMYGLGKRLFISGPPHVQAPEELHRIYLSFDDAGGHRFSPWIPARTATAIRDGVESFSAASVYRTFEDLADFGQRARPLTVHAVDENYFNMLGPVPVAGRFLQQGDVTGALVLSSVVATAEFGSPEAAIGETVRVGNFSGAVIGVAPNGFAGVDLNRVDAWIPIEERSMLNRNWWTIARLAPGQSGQTSKAEAQAIHLEVDPGRSFQWAKEGLIEVSAATADPTGARTTESSIAGLLLAVVALVLVTAWANVLNLLFARVTRRKSEIIVRLALGLGRWRLARLLMAESIMMSAAGGLLSLPVAWGGSLLVRRVLLPDVAWEGAALELDLMIATFAIVLVTGLLLGLLPARYANRMDLSGGLSQTRHGAGGGRIRLQTILAGTQVTLSAALLLCAGLFVKSFWTIRVTNLGVDAAEVLVINLRSLDFSLGSGGEEEEALYRRALQSLRQRSDGSRAALSVGLPFFSNFGMSVHLEGTDSIPELPGGGPFISVVSDGYFEAIGTAIVQGRGVTSQDLATQAMVVVVGESTGRALWPNGNPIGQCVRIGAQEDPCRTVVGVAEDVHRQGYREPPSLQFYLPVGSSASFSGSTLIFRPRAGDRGLESRLATEIYRAAAGVGFVEIRRLDTLLEGEIRPWKLGAVMLSVAAALAIVMSITGVFGVLTYLVSQRRREIGVRMALGATRFSIRRLVLRTGLIAGTMGVGVGFLGVLAASRWLGPLLFETQVADPLVMLLVGGGLLSAAGIACLLPAEQAARVDPVTTLRSEA